MKTNNYFTCLLKKFLVSLFLFYSANAIGQVTVTIGSNDHSNGTFDYPCPIQDFYYASRAQFFYTAAELNALGITAGAIITEIGWVVDSTIIAGYLTEDYSISLLNTNISSLSLNMWETGATQVYGPSNYYYPSNYEGNIMFPVAPFYYAGGNLVVEVCGGLVSGNYTLNPQCHLSDNLPFIASHQWRQDLANGCGATDPTNFATETSRPVLVVSYIPFNFGGPTIEGDLYYDADQSGTRDTNEIGVVNHFITMNPPGYLCLTDANGHYKFYCDTNTYSISWPPVTPWAQTSSPAAYSVSVPPSSTGNDFGIYAPPADVEYSQMVGYITGFMRCNMIGHSIMNIRNNGLYAANGKATLIHSANLPFDSASSTQGFSVTGDTVDWIYTNLLPGQNTSFVGNFHNGAAGDTVTYTYIDSVFDASWNFQRVYTNSFMFVIVCSMDPNDKEVDPAGESAAHYTLKSEELMYTIRFQNTGNDTAFNVTVVDTLDPGLDISTLQIRANSHIMSVQISPDRVMRFVFQDIMLPDSIVNAPASNGYVVYSIKPMNGLLDGTVIYNRANIFFDLNAPVLTNTTFNTLVDSIPTGTRNIITNGKCFIFPNPVKDEARIYLDGKPGVKHWLSVYNSVGQRLVSTTFFGNEYVLSDFFPEGMYMVTIGDEKGKVVYASKFIKE